MLQRIVKISPLSTCITRVSPLTVYVPADELLFTRLVSVWLNCPLANVSVWVPQFSSLVSSWFRGLAARSALLKVVLHVPSSAVRMGKAAAGGGHRRLNSAAVGVVWTRRMGFIQY